MGRTGCPSAILSGLASPLASTCSTPQVFEKPREWSGESLPNSRLTTAGGVAKVASRIQECRKFFFQRIVRAAYSKCVHLPFEAFAVHQARFRKARRNRRPPRSQRSSPKAYAAYVAYVACVASVAIEDNYQHYYYYCYLQCRQWSLCAASAGSSSRLGVHRHVHS